MEFLKVGGGGGYTCDMEAVHGWVWIFSGIAHYAMFTLEMEVSRFIKFMVFGFKRFSHFREKTLLKTFYESNFNIGSTALTSRGKLNF